MASQPHRNKFLSLPAELRLEILSYVLDSRADAGFKLYSSPFLPPTGLYIDDAYLSSSRLCVLLTCRQIRQDFTRMAFQNTHFVLTDTYTPVPKQMAVLQPFQIAALRHVSFVVAGQSHFRDLVHWKYYPFNNSDLQLETLSVVFHRSGHWHYPHDFIKETVALLRRLENVHHLRFIRNGANIKGFFRTWFNRLIGLILKEDHLYRYDRRNGPCLPVHWWEWEFNSGEQCFTLTSHEPMEPIDEEEYMGIVAPWIEQLMMDMQVEEEDPDPRSRIGF